MTRLFALILAVCAAHAQTAGTCQVSSLVPPVRAEGLTEPLGPILMFCSGFGSGTRIMGNFAVYLPVNATNTVDANNLTTQAVLSIDYGSGMTPSGTPAFVNSRMVTFNGVQLTAPANGQFNVQISGVRAAVNQPGTSSNFIAVDLGTPLLLNNTHVNVGSAVSGLYVSLAEGGIVGTSTTLPPAPSMTSLFTAGTAFASTRVTEGFTAAFGARASGETSGTRFLVTYTGFPANARMFLPDRVAGSDAASPTAAGDLGGTQSVGQYLPGSGTLLLSRVLNADASGAGGTPFPAPTGSSVVTLDSVSEVSLTNGAGSAVYEVMDANPNLVEYAQFPTFVSLSSGSATAVANESISLAPVSTVTTATSTDPVPRFAASTPASDCHIVGDCQASYFPALSVPTGPIQLTAISGGSMTSQPGYIPVNNTGGGTMVWKVSVNYVNGSGWIQLEQPSILINDGTVRVFVLAKSLAPGTYQANVVIDAAQAGSRTVPITLTVQAPPPPPPPPPPVVPTISQIVNAATFAPAPLVAGSVATLQGTHLSGADVVVTVGGQAATLLFVGDTQINFVVPAGLVSQSSANVVVSVNGVASAPVAAVLAPAYPVIFAHGIRNQDWSENSASSPAPGGSVLQMFGTGFPAGATVTAQIGSQANLVPLYAGPAPTVPGVQQVNLEVPTGLTPGMTQLILCATVGGQPYCSTSNVLVVD